jgi:hypothetical protein
LETKGLSSENCVGICTDGAPSIVGSIRGFASLVKKKEKKKNPDVTTHCFIHREVLFQKFLEMKWNKFQMMLQKWSTLSKTSSLECLKNCVKTWRKCI